MSITADAVAGSLEAYVRRLGQVELDDDGFDRDVHLFDLGYLDSLGALRLVTFLESEFGIELSDAALGDARFSSINRIARLVEADARSALAR